MRKQGFRLGYSKPSISERYPTSKISLPVPKSPTSHLQGASPEEQPSRKLPLPLLKVTTSSFGGLTEGVCLELGGKDPAYVRADADVDYSAVDIADGAAFNSGQSCCAIERVYVHEKVYVDFVEKIVAELKGYKLGDPNGKFLVMERLMGGRPEYDYWTGC
jgi:Aldehyde dehydrogenase family